MNIQAIGNFYQNNFVKRNNTTFGQGSLIVGAYGSYNPRKDAVDTTAFSTKRKLTDIEICNRM
ncbi:MAG: hypothetical protein MJ180_05525, partial [Candidatus Gastranaerophilales bacterium]|nr:hypothetical protein [Candidatus Gastranaerophilales bacterium]